MGVVAVAMRDSLKKDLDTEDADLSTLKGIGNVWVPIGTLAILARVYWLEHISHGDVVH